MPHPNPKLRTVQPHLVEHNGRSVIALQDPLRIASGMLMVPRELGPLLALCDGTRDARALRAALAVRAGINLPPEALEQILDQLDRNFLLDNERFAAARTEAIKKYRSEPGRTPSSAGMSYPDSPDDLRALLDGYMNDAAEDSPEIDRVRCVICPHIDYTRGGQVYAGTWKAVAEAARQAERVIILGTDHMGSDGQVTPTRQDYATPWGRFPTDQEVVDALVEVIGEEAAFAEELNHIGEHSIELALVWLHYIRGGEPCPLVPILCGSFGSFTAGLLEPQENTMFDGIVRVLGDAARRPNTLVVAAADLAHVGPAFGDMLPYDYVARMRLQSADDKLMAHMEQGNAQGFFEDIQAVEDKYKVCGLPPVYLALRVLEPSQGKRLGYMQCPADEHDTSWVSVCGAALW